MNRHVRQILLLTFLASGFAHGDAFGQERSLDVSIGRLVFDRVPTAIDPPVLVGRPSHLMVTFRDTRRAGSWLQASGAAPFAGDALAWGVGGAGGRFLWPGGSRPRARAGVDVAGHGYLFRESEREVTGTGGVAEAHGVAVVRTGPAALEIRGGWRGQLVSYGGSSTRRAVVEASSRLTFPGPVRVDAESRWVRAAEGVFPCVGATVFAYGRPPIYSWVQAGRWLGAEPFNAVAWSVGAGYRLGGHTRLWLNARQDAPDPLYRNAARRTWSVGLTRLIGSAGPRGVASTRPDRVAILIRIKVADAPPGPISIAGAFNAWRPQPMACERDEWVARLTLPPGVYDYAFRAANGDWFVPASVPGRRSDGMGGYSALLVVQ